MRIVTLFVLCSFSANLWASTNNQKDINNAVTAGVVVGCGLAKLFKSDLCKSPQEKTANKNVKDGNELADFFKNIDINNFKYKETEKFIMDRLATYPISSFDNNDDGFMNNVSDFRAKYNGAIDESKKQVLKQQLENAEFNYNLYLKNKDKILLKRLMDSRNRYFDSFKNIDGTKNYLVYNLATEVMTELSSSIKNDYDDNLKDIETGKSNKELRPEAGAKRIKQEERAEKEKIITNEKVEYGNELAEFLKKLDINNFKYDDVEKYMVERMTFSSNSDVSDVIKGKLNEDNRDEIQDYKIADYRAQYNGAVDEDEKQALKQKLEAAQFNNNLLMQYKDKILLANFLRDNYKRNNFDEFKNIDGTKNYLVPNLVENIFNKLDLSLEEDYYASLKKMETGKSDKDLAMEKIEKDNEQKKEKAESDNYYRSKNECLKSSAYNIFAYSNIIIFDIRMIDSGLKTIKQEDAINEQYGVTNLSKRYGAGKSIEYYKNEVSQAFAEYKKYGGKASKPSLVREIANPCKKFDN